MRRECVPRSRARTGSMDTRFRGNDGSCLNRGHVDCIIPAQACYGQGTCPRCRAGNFGAIPVRRSSTTVIPANAGIHGSRGGRGTSIQAGIHTAFIGTIQATNFTLGRYPLILRQIFLFGLLCRSRMLRCGRLPAFLVPFTAGITPSGETAVGSTADRLEAGRMDSALRFASRRTAGNPPKIT